MSINLLKNADLKDLEVLDSSGLTLSVYLPLDQANIEINRIRLKNAVSEVQALLEERLEDTGIAGQVAEQIAELSSHEVFAKAQYPGLALLVDLEKPEALSAFPLWEQPENRVSVGQEPFLTPLIRDQGYERVTLLCLADNGLRLFRGRCGELSEVSLQACRSERGGKGLRSQPRPDRPRARIGGEPGELTGGRP